jgi:signal peptidase I
MRKLETDNNSQPQAKRSSSGALIERSAPPQATCNIREGNADIFPELMSQVLLNGHKIRFCAPGKSMQPAILDGDCLMVEPVEAAAVKVGDIILYHTQNRIIAHRVMDIGKGEIAGSQAIAHVIHYSFILRGDAAYSYDEPVHADQIVGKIVSVERNGRHINPYSWIYKIECMARIWGARLKRLID